MPLTTNLDDAEIAIVTDVHNVVRSAEETRGPMAGFRSKANNYPTGAVFVSIRKIIAVLKCYGLNRNANVALLLSDQENSDRRRKRYPNYKAGRTRREYSVFEVVEHNGKETSRQHNPITDFMEMIQCLPSLRIVMKDPWETDDAMASAVAYLRKRRKELNERTGVKKPLRIVILSKDRDMWSEMADDVVISGGPQVEFGIGDLTHAYCITKPKLLPLAKALFGDSSDKIKKAVPRVTESNIPEGILDKVKKRKGEHLAAAFIRMLKKNKKLVTGTSLEKALGMEKEIHDLIEIIRLRRKLELILVANKPDRAKMLSLAAWYEFKAMPKDINALFDGVSLGKAPTTPKEAKGAKAGKRVTRNAVEARGSSFSLAGNFTSRRGALG